MRPLRITLNTAREKAGGSRSIVGAINCCQGIGQQYPSSVVNMGGSVAVELRGRVSGRCWLGIVVIDVTCALCTPYTIVLNDGDIFDRVAWRKPNRGAPRLVVLVAQGVSGMHVRDVALASCGVNGKSDC